MHIDIHTHFSYHKQAIVPVYMFQIDLTLFQY